MKHAWICIVMLALGSCRNESTPALENTKKSDDVVCEKSCQPPLQLDATACSCQSAECSACGEWVIGDATPAADSVCAGTLFEQTQEMTRTCPEGITSCSKSVTATKKDVAGTGGKTEENACKRSGGWWDADSDECSCKFSKTFTYDSEKCTGGCRCPDSAAADCKADGKLLDPYDCRCHCDWESKCGTARSEADPEQVIGGTWTGIGYVGFCYCNSGGRFRRDYDTCTATCGAAKDRKVCTNKVFNTAKWLAGDDAIAKQIRGYCSLNGELLFAKGTTQDDVQKNCSEQDVDIYARMYQCLIAAELSTATKKQAYEKYFNDLYVESGNKYVARSCNSNSCKLLIPVDH